MARVTVRIRGQTLILWLLVLVGLVNFSANLYHGGKAERDVRKGTRRRHHSRSRGAAGTGETGTSNNDADLFDQASWMTKAEDHGGARLRGSTASDAQHRPGDRDGGGNSGSSRRGGSSPQQKQVPVPAH